MIEIEVQRHYRFGREDQVRADIGLTVEDYKRLDDLLYDNYGRAEGLSFALGNLTIEVHDLVGLLAQQRKTIEDRKATLLCVLIRFAMQHNITHLS